MKSNYNKRDMSIHSVCKSVSLQSEQGISEEEVSKALKQAFSGLEKEETLQDAFSGTKKTEMLPQDDAGLEKKSKKLLLIPPDLTRMHSYAGKITELLYRQLKDTCHIDIMPALGTHAPMSEQELQEMFGSEIPRSCFITHKWRTETVVIGTIPAQYIQSVSDGLMNEPIEVAINQRLLDSTYDLILSIGQVVPHEVVGMANYTKNILVGCGGVDIINKSHMLGAVCGMEKAMGKDYSPVRKIFDYAQEHFLNDLPIRYILTVTTVKQPDNEKNRLATASTTTIDPDPTQLNRKEINNIKEPMQQPAQEPVQEPANQPGQATGQSLSINARLHSLHIGSSRDLFEQAVSMSQNMNITYVERRLPKVVVYLDEREFKSTWIGNKAIYRTRMAIADDGELLILAPGVAKFGEDSTIDALIRKYGYTGRDKILSLFQENADLQQNLSAAAHLIHGSSEGRFSVTYAVRHLTQKEVEAVNFHYADYDKISEKYNPQSLHDGWNQLPDGEEIYYISNPAVGLWSV